MRRGQDAAAAEFLRSVREQVNDYYDAMPDMNTVSADEVARMVTELRRSAEKIEAENAKPPEKVEPWTTEPDCAHAKAVGGACEGGWIVHPPTESDLQVGESRRMHTACPEHGKDHKAPAYYEPGSLSGGRKP